MSKRWPHYPRLLSRTRNNYCTPDHPRDARESEAAARFYRFLTAVGRADLGNARSQLGGLAALGYRVENLDAGYRLIGRAT